MSYTVLKYKSIELKYIYLKMYSHEIMVNGHKYIFTLQQQQKHSGCNECRNICFLFVLRNAPLSVLF